MNDNKKDWRIFYIFIFITLILFSIYVYDNNFLNLFESKEKINSINKPNVIENRIPEYIMSNDIPLKWNNTIKKYEIINDSEYKGRKL